MLLNQSDLLRHYKNSSARLFLFDWDGTLTPIVRDPAAAVPTAPVLQALSAISSDPKNHFWIISGRDKTFLDTYFGSVPSIGLSAEHGAFVRRPHRTDWEDISGAADKAWQDGVIADLEKFTAKTPGSWIERKDIAITWHYRNAAPELGMLNSKECKQCVQEKISDSPYNLEIIEGKMCLEVRPRNLNKGAIVQRIMDDYKANHAQSLSPDFVFCIGDDVTDEGKVSVIVRTGTRLSLHQICFEMSETLVYQRFKPSMS